MRGNVIQLAAVLVLLLEACAIDIGIVVGNLLLGSFHLPVAFLMFDLSFLSFCLVCCTAISWFLLPFQLLPCNLLCVLLGCVFVLVLALLLHDVLLFDLIVSAPRFSFTLFIALLGSLIRGLLCLLFRPALLLPLLLLFHLISLLFLFQRNRFRPSRRGRSHRATVLGRGNSLHDSVVQAEANVPQILHF